jgi:hypothetical protein
LNDVQHIFHAVVIQNYIIWMLLTRSSLETSTKDGIEIAGTIIHCDAEIGITSDGNKISHWLSSFSILFNNFHLLIYNL